MAKRRVMRTFKLSEISAVDNPAQAGARMVLMKRDEPKMEIKLTDKADGFAASVRKATTALAERVASILSDRSVKNTAEILGKEFSDFDDRLVDAVEKSLSPDADELKESAMLDTIAKALGLAADAKVEDVMKALAKRDERCGQDCGRS